MGTTDALNAAAGKVYTEFKFLSATKVDGAQVKYTCSLQGLYKWDSSWRDLKSTIFERPNGCAPGAAAAVRGPTASATYSESLGSYIVASRPPESGCFEGCQFEQGSGKSLGCYLVAGSTTQGFCNYQMSGIGTTCSASTLIGPATGDSLKKPDKNDTGSGGETGGTTTPPTVPDIDLGDGGSGGSGNGSGSGNGETGGSHGTGGTSGGGSSVPGGGSGGDGSGVPGGGNTGGGSSSGGNTGTGNSGNAGSSSQPCKGINFGEAGCPEYGSAQTLNGTLQGTTDSVKQIQDSLWDSYDNVQNQGNKTQEDAQQSLMQRFGSMLPAPGACVNPVMDFGWTIVAVDVCRYTFVKKLLSWMFASFTLYYVFRVMTSLGSNSEV
ncbi:hypothetical protein ACOI7N_27225 [Pseudomonas sp. P2758]|uniref:hypothetical protein n=1 Tax=Pseudomonas sp. P2758 TaxID=3409916 RepID=UPI003B58F7FD